MADSIRNRQQNIMQYLKGVYKKYTVTTILIYVVAIIAVLGTLDLKDYPSEIINIWGINNFAFFVVLLTVFISLIAYKCHLFDWQKVIAINIFDCLIQAFSYFSILYVVLIMVLSIYSLYKLIICAIIFLICLFFIMKRSKKYSNSLEINLKYSSNIIDLKDLYENKINLKTGVILLEEREVNYDLLARYSIINHLSNMLLNCNPNGKFVISLEGKWGSGKTTILRNVKKILEGSNKDIVIIDDFDPWTYGSEQSIVENFFNCLLRRNELKINTAEVKKYISIFLDAISNTSAKKNLVDFFSNRDSNVIDSKKQINEYLRLCGKKVIIYIDNLDRVEDEKVVFIFKLIGNVLDFERVTYVVSFDNEKVEKVFDNSNNLNMGYDYLKKIIQMQIKLPEVDKRVLANVVQKCTSNLIAFYIKTDKELNEYNQFINFLSKSIKDIRDFKRFINSIMVKILTANSTLSKRDKLVLEYIRMNNYELYKKIYDNRKYFISQDKINDDETRGISFREDTFNNDAKEFFAKLFNTPENSGYKQILGDLFPYVARYNNKQDLIENYFVSDQSDYMQLSKNRSIASGKYFDLYFSDTENRFSALGGYIENYIKSQYAKNDKFEIKQETINPFIDLIPPLHIDLLEMLELYLDDLDGKASLELLNELFENILKVDNSSEFIKLNARERCKVIMWELLQKISEDDYDKFLKCLEGQYVKIGIINGISHWFDNDHDGKNVSDRSEKWKAEEKKMVSNIIDDDVDMYSDTYYVQYNVGALYRNLKEENDLFKEYMKKRMTKMNAFRLLNDIMFHSSGTQHIYLINSENLKRFFDEEEFKTFMKDIVAKSDDEKFLMDVYDNYLRYPNENVMGEHALTFQEEKKLNL